MPYIGTQPKDVRSFGKAQFDFTATAGQTVFSGTDDDGKNFGYTVGQIQVYVNGILMDASDYTATSGSTVVLSSAANANDIITVLALQTDIPLSDYVPASGGTFSGPVHMYNVHLHDQSIEIGSTTNSYNELRFYENTGNGGTRIKAVSGGNLVMQTDNTDRLTINGSGAVTMPYQPAFAAYPLASVTISGAGTYDTVQADAVKTNVGSCYNTSTYLFTAPVSGSYAFFGTVRFNNHNGTYVRAAFSINGTTDLEYASDISQDTGSYATCSVAGVIQLSANDTVSLVGRSQSDASVDISVNGTTFSGHLIG